MDVDTANFAFIKIAYFESASTKYVSICLFYSGLVYLSVDQCMCVSLIPQNMYLYVCSILV